MQSALSGVRSDPSGSVQFTTALRNWLEPLPAASFALYLEIHSYRFVTLGWFLVRVILSKHLTEKVVVCLSTALARFDALSCLDRARDP